jgi:hypothetical protein
MKESAENVGNKGFFSRCLSAARQVSGWLADFLRTLRGSDRLRSGRELKVRSGRPDLATTADPAFEVGPTSRSACGYPSSLNGR